MPQSGVTTHKEVVEDLSTTLCTFRVADSDILLNDDTAEVIAFEVNFQGVIMNTLANPEAYCPWNYATNFDALGEQDGTYKI